MFVAIIDPESVNPFNDWLQVSFNLNPGFYS